MSAGPEEEYSDDSLYEAEEPQEQSGGRPLIIGLIVLAMGLGGLLVWLLLPPGAADDRPPSTVGSLQNPSIGNPPGEAAEKKSAGESETKAADAGELTSSKLTEEGAAPGSDTPAAEAGTEIAAAVPEEPAEEEGADEPIADQEEAAVERAPAPAPVEEAAVEAVTERPEAEETEPPKVAAEEEDPEAETVDEEAEETTVPEIDESIYGPGKVLVLQYRVAPDEGYADCEDTSIASLLSQTLLGENRHLSVSGGEQPEHILMQFSLDKHLAPDALITKAVLYLYPKLYTRVPETVAAYPLTKEWKENQATWIVAQSGVSWSRAGGDTINKRISANVQVDKTGHSWDVTAIVRHWLKYPAENRGLLLKAGAREEAECWYYSSETGHKGFRPRLEITYRSRAEAEVIASKTAEDTKAREEADIAARLKKRLFTTPRPEAPWTVCELEFVLQKFDELDELPEHLLRAKKRGPGTLAGVTKDDASNAEKVKLGKAWYLRDVARRGGEVKTAIIRINESGKKVHIDTDNNGTFDPLDQFKLEKGVVGPITVKGMYNEKNRYRIAHDYTFYIRRRKEYPDWGVRHAGYVAGMWGDRKLRITDINDDCSYASYGLDTIAIDGETYLLNRYMQIDGEWWAVDMAPTGEFIAFAKPDSLPPSKDNKEEEPFSLVKAEMIRGFGGGKKRFKPEIVMFKRIDKYQEGIYIATPEKPVIVVPAGKYVVYYAVIAAPKEKERLIATSGSTDAFDLTGVSQYIFKWGAPFSLAFKVSHKDKSVSVSPWGIAVQDRAKVKYVAESGANLFMTKPKLEFLLNRRIETSKIMPHTGGLKFKVKYNRPYVVRMLARSRIFGELKGQTTSR